MTVFVVVAAVAAALVWLQLVRPFLGAAKDRSTPQRHMNSAIYRDQLNKLEQDLADGSLGADDHAQARAELQRRAIEESVDQQAVAGLKTPKLTLLVTALVVPLVAAGIYLLIGNPASINAADMPAHVAAQAPQEGPGAQDIERMVAGLAAKLENEPDNLKGWAMLARSYKVMGRTVEAEKAFARAGKYLDDDAQLLASYADTVATNANGDFSGKPVQLIQKALKVDPDNPMALWLAGTAALRSNDKDGAVKIWSRLLKLLPPDSEDAKMLQGSIAEIRGSSALAAPAGQEPATARAEATAGASVRGTVVLDAAVKSKAAADDTVMVIARVPGNRMPVAVLRTRVSDWPLKFTLDDSLSMSPQARLSMANEVEVEARISKSGMAKAEPGDLVSAVQTVKVGAQTVELRVDKVRN